MPSCWDDLDASGKSGEKTSSSHHDSSYMSILISSIPTNEGGKNWRKNLMEALRVGNFWFKETDIQVFDTKVAFCAWHV